MNIITNLSSFLDLLISHAHEAAAFVLLMWIIHIVNFMTGKRLSILGVIPRNIPSLFTGPLFSSFLHANTTHLAYNSLPLAAFSAILFANGVYFSACIIMSISIISGIMLWFVGRKGIHIGASGLIMGLMGYFLYNSYYNPGFVNAAVGIVILYYFGSLLLSIFPEDMKTSFEGHACGLASGLLVASFNGCIQAFYIFAKPLAIVINHIALYLT